MLANVASVQCENPDWDLEFSASVMFLGRSSGIGEAGTRALLPLLAWNPSSFSTPSCVMPLGKPCSCAPAYWSLHVQSPLQAQHTVTPGHIGVKRMHSSNTVCLGGMNLGQKFTKALWAGSSLLEKGVQEFRVSGYCLEGKTTVYRAYVFDM